MKPFYKNLLYICKNLKLMRNLLAVLTLFLSVFMFSQETSNRFSDEETQANENSTYSPSGRSINYGDTRDDVAANDDGPPNPSDPIPIDQYVGLLLVTAMGFIVYVIKKKRNFSSSK